MKFHYQAQSKDHHLVEGDAEAPDKFFLAHELKEKGDTPFSVTELRPKKTGMLATDVWSSVSLSEKIMFANNISGMLQAGLSLVRALGILEKQTKNNAFKHVLNSLIDDINKGTTLSAGMKKFPTVFSDVFISMVRSGEESGGLPQSLLNVGINLKKSYDLNKRIKSALTYPTIIVSAIVIITALMMVYVVPTLTKVFKDMSATLPASTRAIISISNAVSSHPILFFAILILCAAAAISFARLKITQRYYDFFILHLPVIGTLVKETNAARTARTLSSLLSSGVDMSKALSVTEEVLQNYYYKQVIHQAAVSIEKGIPLSESFTNNLALYPAMVGEMVAVGEETGKLSALLLDIATFYEAEVETSTKDLSTVIEPVLMVIIGAAVGFFAISMLLPMYTVMDSIK